MTMDALLRVLVVDDNSVEARLARDMLLLQEYDVEVRDNSRDALEELLDEDAPRFDLLVLDINMDEVDGLTMARRLRGTGNMTPIMFVSGGPPNGVSLAIQGMGPTVSFMMKPFGKEEFLKACAALISAGQLSVAVNEIRREQCRTNELLKQLASKILSKEDVGGIVAEKVTIHCQAKMNACAVARKTEVGTAITKAIDPENLAKSIKGNTLVSVIVILCAVALTVGGGWVWHTYQLANQTAGDLAVTKVEVTTIHTEVSRLGAIPKQVEHLTDIVEGQGKTVDLLKAWHMSPSTASTHGSPRSTGRD